MVFSSVMVTSGKGCTRASTQWGQRAKRGVFPAGWRGKLRRVGEIRLSRIYDHEPKGSGRRFLVERLWPRGVRRDDVELDGWLKDVAPSTELRKWFGHRPERWTEFRERYIAELDASAEAWRPLRDAAK